MVKDAVHTRDFEIFVTLLSKGKIYYAAEHDFVHEIIKKLNVLQVQHGQPI